MFKNDLVETVKLHNDSSNFDRLKCSNFLCLGQREVTSSNYLLFVMLMLGSKGGTMWRENCVAVDGTLYKLRPDCSFWEGSVVQ